MKTKTKCYLSITDQADEIKWLKARLARLGSSAEFVPCPNDSFTNFQEWYTDELGARMGYANGQRTEG